MGLSGMTQRTIRIRLEKREEFQLDNIRAIWLKKGDPLVTGRLPQNYVEYLTTGQNMPDSIYVVYSYNTPIAWLIGEEWVVPAQTYTHTTTQHQNVIKSAIGTYVDIS